MEPLKLSITVSILLFGILIASGQGETDASWKTLEANDSLPSIRSQEQALQAVSKGDSVRKPGTIIIHQDEKLDELIANFDRSDKSIDGYRIQIFLGKPKEAQKIRTKFVAKYPDIPAYDPWQTPNMKIRIGDFTSKLDAERALKVIRKDYPGAYIVRDKVELSDLDAAPFGIKEE